MTRATPCSCWRPITGTSRSRALLDHGASPEITNDRGQTPLAGAAFKGDAAVRLPLERGADVNGRGEGGHTARMVAAMFNRVEIAELLLAHGADPNARDARGFTAQDSAEIMGAADTPAQLARATRA